jgi:hypothetical protein
MNRMRQHADTAATGLRPIAVAALSSMVAALLAVNVACHRMPVTDEKPVTVGLPAQVSTKADNAQTGLIDAVGMLAAQYDEAVCEEETQMAEGAWERRAQAETNVENARQHDQPHEQVQTYPEDAPPSEAEIIIIEEEQDEQRDRGGWSCHSAGDQPRCLQASANTVARAVHQRYVQGYDLNPVTAGDVMEAFAAEIAWGQQYLSEAGVKSEGLAEIERRCRAGQSPLKRFFDAAADFQHPRVRADLLRIRDEFAPRRAQVCEGLPSFYSTLLDELDADLTRRVRTQRCRAPQWDPIWGS